MTRAQTKTEKVTRAQTLDEPMTSPDKTRTGQAMPNVKGGRSQQVRVWMGAGGLDMTGSDEHRICNYWTGSARTRLIWDWIGLDGIGLGLERTSWACETCQEIV